MAFHMTNTFRDDLNQQTMGACVVVSWKWHIAHAFAAFKSFLHLNKFAVDAVTAETMIGLTQNVRI